MSSFETQSKADEAILNSFEDPTKFPYMSQEAVVLLAVFAALVCAFIIFQTRSKLSWRMQFWYLLSLGFVVSIPWEWFHLYRKAFAAKLAKMEKDIPQHCRKGHELYPWESLVFWLKSTFTFSSSDDICVKYQESLLVDPIWKISPLKAISATIARSISQPFEHIAETIGKSFRALFKEVPIQWQPFVFIAVIVIIIIILAMFMLLLFIINSKPALPENAQANIQQLQQKVQNVEAILQQLNEAPSHKTAQKPADEEMENLHGLLQQIHQGLRKESEKKGLKRRHQEDEAPPLDALDG